MRAEHFLLAAVPVVPERSPAAGPGVGGIPAGQADKTLRKLRRGLRPGLQPGEVLSGVREGTSEKDGCREASTELCEEDQDIRKRTAGGAVPSTVAGRGSPTSHSSLLKVYHAVIQMSRETRPTFSCSTRANLNQMTTHTLSRPQPKNSRFEKESQSCSRRIP